MSELYYIGTGSTDPYYNLAFEEHIFESRREGTYVLLWQNDNAVIIGRNQNAEAEIDSAFAEKHGTRLVRRNTGGGAVYHDLGNLNYSIITDGSDAEDSAACTQLIVDALRSLGLDAQASGRNDILAGGKKISGTASRMSRGRMLFHGTLLFDSDLGRMAGVLTPGPEKFRGKAVKSVSGRVGNIRPMLANRMTLEEFWERIKAALLPAPFTALELNEKDLAEVRSLMERKYLSPEWNFGSPLDGGSGGETA